ncbi:MAG: fused MFS/spermidine synthase [Methyloprofundus sp.]|nr:fused MFS/spermidine synthase [Methyloprofundus sp.]MDT8427019.1 fused MFS/spermidine synthase [Methyloprofundus sp.]
MAVAMISLSIGYFVGGRLADFSKHIGLSLIIALAAVFTLAIPLLTRFVLLMTDPLGLRGGAFVSALILFSPSLTMLGMVSPFAIKLATSKLDGVGSSAGSIYAVSTLGSVIGTLLLGFFLFPTLGSRTILLATGFILLVLATIISINKRKRLGSSITVVPCVIFAFISLIFGPKIVDAGHSYSGGSKFKIMSENESLYGWVRVIDEPTRDLRILTSDASTIGASSINTGKSRLTYQDIVGLIPAMRPKMSKALIVGLGAGHMANVLKDRYGIIVDTLEIDPAVAEAATHYFGYVPNGRAIIGDARYEIRHLTGPYDLIIHDCFTGGSEPSHLLTIETLAQLKNLLSPNGIMALNFVSFSKDNNPALASVAKTIDQIFPHQSVFISDPGEDFNDFIFLASDTKINYQTKQLKTKELAWLELREFQVNQTEGVILSDDFNPLEHLQTRKAEHYRHVVVDWFGANLLIR